MKCRVCRGPAVIDLARHNANFCAEHFVAFVHRQVAKAIDDYSMIEATDRVLVAVSGGKDSLGLWQILLDLGYDADGLYLGLGIGDYSGSSADYARRFADGRGAKLVTIDLPSDEGFDIETASAITGRVPCSACGLSKRYLFDRAARDGGYDVVATGHNLDDEAAVLFGNTLTWNREYLGRQVPVLEGRQGFARKVKPLVRLSEREMAAYCVVRGIDYIVEECPMAAGNRHLGYKEALNAIESRSPGTKAAFYFGFLDRIVGDFRPETAGETDSLRSCSRCGAPTTNEVCAYCALRERVTETPIDAPRRRR
jgi:uncharacterized protein (TIGR00269 family)